MSPESPQSDPNAQPIITAEQVPGSTTVESDAAVGQRQPVEVQPTPAQLAAASEAGGPVPSVTGIETMQSTAPDSPNIVTETPFSQPK